MAIFSTKKNKKEKKGKDSSVSSDAKKNNPEVSHVAMNNMSSVLLCPRITEKSSMLGEKGSYVFEISDRANKHDVFTAVKAVYGVTPIKVNITNLPAKKVFSRGRAGAKSGIKKAVVYLKSGDKIEIA